LIGLQITTQLEVGFWLVNFLGAILLYAAIVIVWFYYTFWEMHKQMVKQKKVKILRYQLEFRQSDNEGDDGDDDAQTTVEKPIGELDDKEYWQELYDAPVWPINTQKMSAVVTGNLLPIALSLPTVLPSLFSAWGI
jgi:amino acid permease